MNRLLFGAILLMSYASVVAHASGGPNRNHESLFAPSEMTPVEIDMPKRVYSLDLDGNGSNDYVFVDRILGKLTACMTGKSCISLTTGKSDFIPTVSNDGVSALLEIGIDGGTRVCRFVNGHGDMQLVKGQVDMQCEPTTLETMKTSHGPAGEFVRVRGISQDTICSRMEGNALRCSGSRRFESGQVAVGRFQRGEPTTTIDLDRNRSSLTELLSSREWTTAEFEPGGATVLVGFGHRKVTVCGAREADFACSTQPVDFDAESVDAWIVRARQGGNYMDRVAFVPRNKLASSGGGYDAASAAVMTAYRSINPRVKLEYDWSSNPEGREWLEVPLYYSFVNDTTPQDPNDLPFTAWSDYLGAWFWQDTQWDSGLRSQAQCMKCDENHANDEWVCHGLTVGIGGICGLTAGAVVSSSGYGLPFAIGVGAGAGGMCAGVTQTLCRANADSRRQDCRRRNC